jgi:hypothetical protein
MANFWEQERKAHEEINEMSLKEFWMNVRLAARMTTPIVTADAPRLSSEQIEEILRSAPIWLTPRAVESFDERDFDFLSADERQQLSDAVRQFRNVAAQVDPKKPSTDLQIQEALPHFQRIVEILGGNKYADYKALVIGKRIERHIAGRIPDTVLELRFETGVDSSGGNGLWIWVIFKDDVAVDENVLFANVRAVEQLMRDAVRQLGIKRWPYVRLRTISELELLAAEKAEE